MYGAKPKIIGGREYMVIGSTIDRGAGFKVIRASYTTTVGKVVVEGGQVTHPDGAKTPA